MDASIGPLTLFAGGPTVGRWCSNIKGEDTSACRSPSPQPEPIKTHPLRTSLMCRLTRRHRPLRWWCFSVMFIELCDFRMGYDINWLLIMVALSVMFFSRSNHFAVSLDLFALRLVFGLPKTEKWQRYWWCGNVRVICCQHDRVGVERTVVLFI